MMLFLPNKNTAAEQQKILLLEKEITALEAELAILENAVNTFQHKIRLILSVQIRRIQELNAICKNKKHAKKQQRLEQKKRGKNYREPTGLKVASASFTGKNSVSENKQQEMKRLYREAIVKVHPDKLTDANEHLYQKATAVTVELNALYQNGDFEALNQLHEQIISGYALHYQPQQLETICNLPEMMLILQRKKHKLEMLLAEIQHSDLYKLKLRHPNIDILIEELKLQFEVRIAFLEKRVK